MNDVIRFECTVMRIIDLISEEELLPALNVLGN